MGNIPLTFCNLKGLVLPSDKNEIRAVFKWGDILEGYNL